MLTACDMCAFLGECSKELEKQLTKCSRYKFFLEDLQKAIARIPGGEKAYGQQLQTNHPG